MFCTICKHAERDAIDQAIVAGKSARALSRIYELSHHSINRHAKHLPQIIAKGVKLEDEPGDVEARRDRAALLHADDLLQRIEENEAEFVRLQAAAEKANDIRAAIMARREITRLISLRAEIAGQINKPAAVNVLNLNVDENTARRAMMAYLEKERRKVLTA